MGESIRDHRVKLTEAVGRRSSEARARFPARSGAVAGKLAEIEHERAERIETTTATHASHCMVPDPTRDRPMMSPF